MIFVCKAMMADLLLETILKRQILLLLSRFTKPKAPSYMVYFGRDIPTTDRYESSYVTDTMLNLFLTQ